MKYIKHCLAHGKNSESSYDCCYSTITFELKTQRNRDLESQNQTGQPVQPIQEFLTHYFNRFHLCLACAGDRELIRTD